jgi:histidinol-phosphate aminotransferase
MSQFSSLITKQARGMDHYTPPTPAESAAHGPRIIRLDSNENPLGPSPRALGAMRRALTDTHLYPDNDCRALTDRLSEFHEIPAEQILVTSGSTGMLSLLCHTLLEPGRNAITSEKSFIVYGMAVRATGAELIETPTRNQGFDLSAILNAVNDHTRLIVLANPNNPTGTIIEADELARFLGHVPGHAVVVLDEAYYEFAASFAQIRKVEYSRSLTYLRQNPGLVMLRTFSKAQGLAGLRIGYGVGPRELISYCRRMQDPYSVSSVAQAAALAALDDTDHIVRSVSHNADQAEILQKGLSELGLRTIPTWANFVYCELEEDAADVARRLREQGISIRPLGGWGAPNSMRITIGTAQQNDRFLSAMRKLGRRSRRAP